MVPLADIHCHIFNASDLPAEKFIKIVFLGLYPKDAPPDPQRLLNTSDEDVVDWLINLFLAIAGEGAAPTASDELQVLNGNQAAIPSSTNAPEARLHTIQQTAGFLRQLESPAPMSIRARSTSERGATIIRDALRRAGGVGAPLTPIGALDVQSSEALVEKAYDSNFDIGVYIRWFELFRQYRYAHVDRLASDHASEGFDSIVISPAMIDYSKWLDENTTSDLVAQVTVMEAVAKRTSGPRVRGYVAFDPLRYVYYKKGVDTSFDPLALVRTAITSQGFLGVKLYPPMGFRASQNLNTQSAYPPWVETKIKADIGTSLDAALEELYALCQELDAPIIAHTAHSNQSGPDYGLRADPVYWIPVFKAHTKLRVCLAHFGRFDYNSTEFPQPHLPETSWEWVIADYIKANPDCSVYADLAYFDAVIDSTVNRTSLSNAFKEFAAQSPDALKHIMFGTDWIMLGNESGYPKYTRAVFDFLSNDCGFTTDQVADIFVGNALRFYPPGVADEIRLMLQQSYKSIGGLGL